MITVSGKSDNAERVDTDKNNTIDFNEFKKDLEMLKNEGIYNYVENRNIIYLLIITELIKI